MRRTLVIMLKEPRPGRVKTRLGQEIGMTAAAWWFRHHTAGILRRLSDPRWELVLAVSPDREGLHSRVWPRHLRRWPQGRGDLGVRMVRMLRMAGSGPVCIIGSDIAGLKKRHVARAFRHLGSCDVVFGPSPDGGYWLVGVRNGRRVPHGLFEGVRWSTAHALADSIASVPGKQHALADPLSDVDTLDDLRMTARGARAT